MTANDFRDTIRHGVKRVAQHIVVYRVDSPETRVGVIVSKRCGTAVTRNLLRRRTRAILRACVDQGTTGDIVVRFRCDGETPSFDQLRDELTRSIGALE